MKNKTNNSNGTISKIITRARIVINIKIGRMISLNLRIRHHEKEGEMNIQVVGPINMKTIQLLPIMATVEAATVVAVTTTIKQISKMIINLVGISIIHSRVKKIDIMAAKAIGITGTKIMVDTPIEIIQGRVKTTATGIVGATTEDIIKDGMVEVEEDIVAVIEVVVVDEMAEIMVMETEGVEEVATVTEAAAIIVARGQEMTTTTVIIGDSYKDCLRQMIRSVLF